MKRSYILLIVLTLLMFFQSIHIEPGFDMSKVTDKPLFKWDNSTVTLSYINQKLSKPIVMVNDKPVTIKLILFVLVAVIFIERSRVINFITQYTKHIYMALTISLTYLLIRELHDKVPWYYLAGGILLLIYLFWRLTYEEKEYYNYYR